MVYHLVVFLTQQRGQKEQHHPPNVERDVEKLNSAVCKITSAEHELMKR